MSQKTIRSRKTAVNIYGTILHFHWHLKCSMYIVNFLAGRRFNAAQRIDVGPKMNVFHSIVTTKGNDSVVHVKKNSKYGHLNTYLNIDLFDR